MTSLTAEHLHAILPSAPEGDIEEELPSILRVMREYQINTKLRCAAFLANVAKESGQLMYVEEIDEGWYLEGREDLGNVYEGDGPRFKGHGYIQITGRHNHDVVGKALGVDAISDPAILTQMPYAWLSAGYYWRYMSSWGDLNDYADQGDFETTVLGVRGGEDPERRWYYDKAMEVLPDDLDLSAGEETVTEPSRERSEPVADHITLGYDQEGWAYDTATGLYVKSDIADLDYKTNEDGWLLAKVDAVQAAADTVQISADTVQISADTVVETAAETVQDAASTWSWPESWDDPISDSEWYVQRCPTRYTWPGNRDDIDAVARRLVSNYDVTVNTYLYHPEDVWINKGISREYDSFDVWGPGGRGDPIGYELGQEIFWVIRNDPNPPNIEWIIWWGYIYEAWNNWEGTFFSDDTSDADMGHYRHIHVTYE